MDIGITGCTSYSVLSLVQWELAVVRIPVALLTHMSPLASLGDAQFGEKTVNRGGKGEHTSVFVPSHMWPRHLLPFLA